MKRLEPQGRPFDNSPEISQLLVDLDDQESVLTEVFKFPTQKPIGKSHLSEITNRTKHQELFLTYAEDKLSKLLPNLVL